jgi:septal ring factor EnvC (AmiA/AmiB activator)
VLRSHESVQLGLLEKQKQREQLLVQLNNEFQKKSQQLTQLEANADEVQTLIDKLQQAALAREQQEAQDSANSKGIIPPNAKENVDGDGNLVKPQLANNIIAESNEKPFEELKGQLPLPVKGAIIKKFGSRRFETRWDGVLISAPEGTDIQATSSGYVVFADWLRGYGLLIIIDHGHGYMTLYAFNQTVYKKVGDRVKAGTVIGAVGKSDGREEAGLYFGIRSKGKPVNPMLWCKSE